MEGSKHDSALQVGTYENVPFEKNYIGQFAKSPLLSSAGGVPNVLLAMFHAFIS